MPFQPRYEGEIPTLGWQVLQWVETYLRIPDGELAGQPFVFTKSQAEFFLRLFRVQQPYGKAMHYARAARIASKGTGKSPTGAVLALIMVGAPIMPDGFDANGRPVGKPVPSPYVQIAGVSEAQAGNVYELLAQMVGAGGPLFDAIPDLDLGQTRVNIGRNTVIEPVSSAAGAREGQRSTGGIMEETQHWTQSNGGIRLAGVMRRNVTKMRAISFGMAVEFSNAPEPGLNTVAERTINGVLKGLDNDVLLDMPLPGRAYEWADDNELRMHLRDVYGDTLREFGGWVDLEAIVRAVRDSTTDLSDAKRYYGNIMAAGQGIWLDDPQRFADGKADIVVGQGEQIAIGFDGGQVSDSTVIRGCRISDGHRFTIGMWEKPLDWDEKHPGVAWQVPRSEVKATFRVAMNFYRVLRAYCDPPYWQDEVTDWMAEWPEQVFEWQTNRDTPMAAALERLLTSIKLNTFTNDGDPRVLVHYGNAYKRISGAAEKPLVLIKKESPESMRKIDAVVTDALALEARADALEAGLPEDVPEDYYALYDLS